MGSFYFFCEKAQGLLTLRTGVLIKYKMSIVIFFCKKNNPMFILCLLCVYYNIGPSLLVGSEHSVICIQYRLLA